MAIKNTNSRIGTPTNLESGGTYDLLMITYPDGFPEGQIKFNIDVTPRKITGVQKVAQVFLKNLMTSKGSNVIYPNQGTSFPSLAINSNITRSDGPLQAEIVAAVSDAADQTQRTMNTIGTDTSSMLAEVSVLGIDIGQDSVVMYLTLQTQDGFSANLAIPFPEFDLE